MVGCYHGMIPNESIVAVMQRIVQDLDDEWLIIVRSIDSAVGVKDIMKALAMYNVKCSLVGANVCMSTGEFKHAMLVHVFAGFDEVWFISGPPPRMTLDSVPYVTSDGADLSVDVPTELRRAMEQVGCVLVLGDGCGLNYATTSSRLGEQIASR